MPSSRFIRPSSSSSPIASLAIRTALRAVLLGLLLGLGLAAGAAAQFPDASKASLELVPDRTAYAPGEEVWLAGLVTVDDHWHVNSNTPSEEFLIPTELDLELPAGVESAELIYPPHKMMRFPFAPDPIAVYDGTVRILARFTLPADAAPGSLAVSGSLRYQACDDRQCLPPTDADHRVELVVGPGGVAQHVELFSDDDESPTQVAAANAAANADGQPVAAGAGETGGASTGPPPQSLALMLLLGVVGGLILNAMPCVLPVLSLKIFGLVKSGGRGRRHLVTGALATVAGVLVSFWALALAAIVAARAGAAVGWGVQFQQPVFVTFLTVVVVLFSLNMWGLFEIPLPQGLARLGSAGSSREGLAGHFMSGLFATLMATPCSAPFLGTAVGFALAQPPAIIVLVFTAIGFGLALPYVALAVLPGVARWLPKPGAWMDTVRRVMGFLLAAAAVWLFYVLAAQISAERIAFVQLSLLALALCTWWLRESQGWVAGRRLATLGIVVTSAACIVFAARAPSIEASTASTSQHFEWLAFDEAEAEALAAEGRPVFAHFTADWCLTCKANERLVIETSEVAEAFDSHDVVTMKGDWTNRDDVITEFLARHDRSAVPFYILYRPGAEPHVFGELLTKSSLITVLEESSRVAVAGAGS